MGRFACGLLEVVSQICALFPIQFSGEFASAYGEKLMVVFRWYGLPLIKLRQLLELFRQERCDKLFDDFIK